LHYSKTENWVCVLYTGAHYIRDFMVSQLCEAQSVQEHQRIKPRGDAELKQLQASYTVYTKGG